MTGSQSAMNQGKSTRHQVLIVLAIALCFTPVQVQGQAAGGRSEIFAGSELENYIRLLQIDGKAALYPWSIRSFSPKEVDRLLAPGKNHPWAGHFDLGPSSDNGFEIDLVRPRLTTYFNSTFPWGANDGPVWAGRGVTASLQAGVAARYGPVSLTLAPMVFGAQNAGFDMQDNGRTGNVRFADGRFPTTIDRPQRFGDGAYSRVDLGQTTLRIDLPVVALGASTANQSWGPARSPILLSNNAAGFPHVFLGSSSPIDLGIARVHGRLVWGKLSQSDYTGITGSARRRFMSGIIGVISPKGVEGLELGAARFFHQVWPVEGLSLSSFTKPFESILKVGLPDDPNNPANPGSSADNQLASVFARWAFPRSGFEVYAEYGREDHNWNFRDFLLQPDHSGGYVLGATKVIRTSPESFYSIRAEAMNMQVSQLIRGRGEGPFYVHSRSRQGHTYLGQVLGNAAGVGGNGTVIAVDRYHPKGRWTAFWSRELRQDVGTFWKTGIRTSPGFDVQYALGAEVLLFGERFDVTASVTGVYNLARYLGDDGINLNARFSIRSNWGPTGSRPAGLDAGDADAASAGSAEPPRWKHHGIGEPKMKPLILVNDPLVDRRRLGELIGDVEANRQILRSPSQVTPRLGARPGVRVAALAPEVEWTWNSDLPFSMNQGTLWAGRGSNARLRVGFQADWGPVSLILAPEFTRSENRGFDLPDPRHTPLADRTGNTFADPFYVSPASIDRPLRFGDSSLDGIHAGQSTLSVRTGAATFGLSTENEWWGPGVRNAIVLSNNAPGFAHFFARTGKPIETAIGTFEGRLLLGALGESSFFDSVQANDTRSFSGFAFTWRPPGLPGLALGATRVVYRPVDGPADVLPRLFDAFFSFPGRPNDRPVGDSTQTPGPDQIYSLFGRWVFPKSGLEVYTEYSRTEFPASFRDLLEAPGHTQGYTLGLQWARAMRGGQDAFRVQTEHTFLERSTTFRDRPVGTYYTSRAVPQGYTNQGRVLGAAIGPGSSSHWLALDYFGPQWEVGVFGERIRWNNDALFDIPLVSRNALLWCKPDVTIRGGIRGAYSLPFGRVSASLSRGKRMNVFFNHFTVCGRDENPAAITDVGNTTFELKYSFR